MRAGNLALKFGVELAALAALVVWGASVGWAMAVLAPAAMIVLWGTLAAVALFAAGPKALAVALAAAIALNALLLTAFAQWEA